VSEGGGPAALAADPTASAAELAAYYPTQVLSTARDIIFLWVARMVMSSLYFLDDEVPFEDVLIHPTVLDKYGNIMSKSRGNGIDPLELIEEYGADSMRFGLALQVTGSQDLKFDKDKIMTMARNFATKIWNAARFVTMNLEDFDLEAARAEGAGVDGAAAEKADGEGRVAPLAATDADRWILSRLARLVAELAEGRDSYEFGATARRLYSFFWSEFCDWYIEFSKNQLAAGGVERIAAQRNLVFVLDTALRLLHPIMPFLTEKIWLSLPHGDTRPSLIVAAWPNAADYAGHINEAAERATDALCAVVGAARAARARYGISPKEPLDVVVKATGADAPAAQAVADALAGQASQIQAMARTARFEVSIDAEKPAQSAVTIAPSLEIYVVLEGLVDFEAERARLAKERAKKAAELEKLEKKLANEGFLAKADVAVVEKAKADATELSIALAQIDQQLADLG
jgi:valyl-tRNA synthetase